MRVSAPGVGTPSHCHMARKYQDAWIRDATKLSIAIRRCMHFCCCCTLVSYKRSLYSWILQPQNCSAVQSRDFANYSNYSLKEVSLCSSISINFSKKDGNFDFVSWMGRPSMGQTNLSLILMLFRGITINRTLS